MDSAEQQSQEELGIATTDVVNKPEENINSKLEDLGAEVLSKFFVFGDKMAEKIEVAVDAVLNKIDGIEEVNAVR